MAEYVNPGVLISDEELEAKLGNPSIRVVEVDEDTSLYGKGHIPGASNSPWSKAAAEDGTFRSADELKELYANAGVSGDKPIIAYCRIGERSSHSWFVLTELLGYDNVKNYDGSWTEYGSLVGVPVER